MNVNQLIALVIGCFLAIPALIRLAIAYILNPKLFRRIQRSAPACLNDPSLGEHGFLRTASNIRIHYVAKGDENRPLMLLLHGFPEFWYSWRHQLKDLGDQHRIVAIDMRGYGESDKPRGKENYKTNLLSKDVKEVVEGLGYSSCILVAHDWGGAIAWRVAHEYPGIIDKLIILNAPHFGIFRKYLKSHFSQFKKSLYFMFFQVPFVPELVLQANDLKALIGVFRSKRSLLASLTDFDKIQGLKKPEMFTDDDEEAFKYTFGRAGAFTPPLNYYRSALMANEPMAASSKKNITAPVLVIWGTDDVALERGLLVGLEKYVDNLTIRLIEGASHWIQQEEPALVNSYIQQFVSN